MTTESSTSTTSNPPAASRQALTPNRSLLRDTRGALTTEYVILVGTMALTFMAAMLVVGPRLLQDFYRSRAVVQSPFP